MLLVFVFHCMRFFDHEEWHVKNDELAVWASAFVQVTWRFMMPLFFVVSAFASYYSLRSHSAGQYLASRLKRLLVPFLFGSCVFLFLHAPVLRRLYEIDEIDSELAREYADRFAELVMHGIAAPRDASS